MATDVDARARECASACYCDMPMAAQLTTDECQVIDIFARHIATALRERDAEWQGKLDEAEAQAAAMREAFGELLTYLHTINDDRAVGFSAPMPVEVLENAQAALNNTAGRDLLAEVERLRGEVERLHAIYDAASKSMFTCNSVGPSGPRSVVFDFGDDLEAAQKLYRLFVETFSAITKDRSTTT